MPVNPFIAALGNILEGASSDRERTRKLKELEEDRQYTKLLQKQATETYDQGKKDAELRRAREQFADERLYEKLGYKSESDLQDALTSLGDPRKYELGAASFDLSNVARSPMDNLASKPVGPLRPSPFTGSQVGVIGQDPFSSAKAQGMIKEAGKTGQRNETQRMLASLQTVPGGKRMYVPNKREDEAETERITKRAADLALDATHAEQERTANIVEKKSVEQTARMVENLKNAGFSEKDISLVLGGVPVADRSISAEKAAELRQRMLEANVRATPKMTSTSMKGYIKNEETIKNATEIIAELQTAMKEKRNITGPLAQWRPGFKSMTNVPGTNWHPYNLQSQFLTRRIQKIMNTELYDISGKAVTKTEMERAVGAMPGIGISEEMNIESLQALINHAELQNEMMSPYGSPLLTRAVNSPVAKVGNNRSPQKLTDLLKEGY